MRRWLDEISDGRTAEYVTVIAVAIVQSVVWAMMIPVVPLRARSLGATEVQIGFISILPAALAVVCSLPGGALVTRYGKRAAFMGCGIMSIISAFLFLTAKSLPGMILPQLFNGASNMLFWPTEKTYLVDIIPEKHRAKVMGYSMGVTALGGIAGPITAGRLIDTLGFDSVFYLYIVLGVLGVVTAMPLPRTDRNPSVSILSTFTGGFRQMLSLWGRPVLRVAVLTTFAQYINCAVTEYFMPVFLKEAGYSATLIGSTVTLRTAGTTLVRLFVGSIAARIGMMNLLFGVAVVCAIAIGLIPIITTVPYIVFATFAMGAAFGMAPVITAAVLGGETEPRERNIAMAIDSTSMYTSRMLTGSSLGALAGVVGYGPAITFGNGLVVLAVMGLVGIYSKHRTTKASASAPAQA